MPKCLITLITSLGLLLSAGVASAADEFKFDQSHLTVGFFVNHLGYSKMLGRFDQADGSLILDPDDWSRSKITVNIKTSSVNTFHKKRDEHLRGPDFFKAKEFPEMTFVSTKIEKTGENQGRMTGNLTLLGVTKTVTLEITLNKLAPHPIPFYKGVMVAGVSARGTINRSEFGMKYGLGGIGDEIELILEVEAHKK